VLLAVRTAADTSINTRATAERRCYGQQSRPRARPGARVGTPTTLPIAGLLAVVTATLDGLHRGRLIAHRVSGGELAQGRVIPSTENLACLTLTHIIPRTIIIAFHAYIDSDI